MLCRAADLNEAYVGGPSAAFTNHTPFGRFLTSTDLGQLDRRRATRPKVAILRAQRRQSRHRRGKCSTTRAQWCLRYAAGATPTILRNQFVRWLCEEKPVANAISAIGILVPLNSRRACSIRRLTT